MGAAKDLQAYLATQGLIDGATGWPSSRAIVHDASDRLVVLTEAGGPQPGPRTGEEYQAVQVRVRGAPGEADAAVDELRAIYDEIQGVTNVAYNGTAYIEVKADNGVVLLEVDDKNRPHYVQTFSLLR